MIPFRVPYFYDPRKGNLLVDMVIPDHFSGQSVPDPAGRRLRIETTAGLEDGMSSMWAAGTNPERATEINPFGLVTQFWMGGFPKLSVTPLEDTIVLTWPYVPEPAKLQYRDDANADTPWKDYIGPGYRTDLTLQLQTIPRSSLPPRRFFRLFWNSPQVSLPDTPIEVTRDMQPTPPNP